MASAETILEGYFATYERATAMLGQTLRTRLRARLPGLNEIVYRYETQGSLVISYSPTDKGYDGVCTLALKGDRVRLGFGRGAELAKSDPAKLLKGRGKTVRQIDVTTLAEFERPEVEELIAAAVKLAKVKLDEDARGALIVQAEEQARRAKKAAG